MASDVADILLGMLSCRGIMLAGIKHHLPVAGITAERVERCSGHEWILLKFREKSKMLSRIVTDGTQYQSSRDWACML